MLHVELFSVSVLQYCSYYKGCHTNTYCSAICDRGQNRSQKSSRENPTSQRSNSVDGDPVGQELKLLNKYHNRNLPSARDFTVSLQKLITCKILLHRNLYCVNVMERIVSVKGQALV